MTNVPVQFLGYALVGVIGTMVHYVVLIVGVNMAGATPLTASSLGAVLGAITNYLLNYRFTFRASKPHPATMTRFFAVALMGLAINGGVIELVIRILAFHYLIAQIAATATVLLFGFAANRCWTFKEDSNEQAPV
jgi:putative flippase GtrA